MPLSFSENIAVFIHGETKDHRRTFNNIATLAEIDQNQHFTR